MIARLLWIALSLSAIGLFAFGLFPYWTELREACIRGAQACSNQNLLTPKNVRELRALGLSVDFYAAYQVAADTIFAAVWCGVGAVIFWRRSNDGMALLVALFLVVFGAATFSGAPLEALADAHPAFWLPVKAVEFLGEICVVLFFYTFPGGRFAPRWTRLFAVAYLLLQAPDYFFPNSPFDPYNHLPPALGFAVFLFFIASFLFAQVYRYRYVSNTAQRRQTKWVIFGLVAAIAGFFASLFPFFFTASGEVMHISYLELLQETGGNLSMMLIPFGIGVAMLRSRLFDVDVLINRTLVYGTLSTALILLYSGSVALLQWAFVFLTGDSSQLTIVASTLVIAALFSPARRRIQNFIDRRFYRKKYDAAKTLEAFSSKLRDETNLDDLDDDLVSVVRQTMQPEHVSLWLKPPDDSARRRPMVVEEANR